MILNALFWPNTNVPERNTLILFALRALTVTHQKSVVARYMVSHTSDEFHGLVSAGRGRDIIDPNRGFNSHIIVEGDVYDFAGVLHYPS